MNHIPNQNARYTQEYLELVASEATSIADRRATRHYMDTSTAIVKGRHVASSFIPRLYDAESFHTMRFITETTHGILCKVIQQYLNNPDYRRLFSYDPRLVELILLPRDYPHLLPFARFDIFLDEDDMSFGFCEFNADGSSGMNENREITRSIQDSQAYQRFAERHSLATCELFDSWVDEFMAIYDSYTYRVDNPHICICDYLEHAVIAEFEVFCEYFKQKGIDASICDVRKLSFDGEVLVDDKGQAVHAIWRRSVTNDVLEHWDESQALIEAVRAHKVALIGSFAGHIVHDKQIFEALHHPETQAFLTEEEQAFVATSVPVTKFLDEAHIKLADIRANKDAWIIKPTDSYGASDVFAGSLYTQEQWEDLIDTYANSKAGAPFLVQRYITPYKTLTLPPDLGISQLSDDEVDFAPTLYNNLEGLYCYNGRFTGVFSRLGPKATISKPLKGITSATVWVDCFDA